MFFINKVPIIFGVSSLKESPNILKKTKPALFF